MRPELEKKVQRAIHLIQAASKKAEEVGQQICISFSGGKDSTIILELTKMADVKYSAIYHNTTIDPPHTIQFCKDNGVEVINPKMSFLELIKYSGFPNRFYRFCCKKLKEIKNETSDYIILGIRADESTRRKERYKEPEACRVFNKKKGLKERQYFPILDWNLQDIEEFIIERGIKLHPLYYDENGNLDVSRRLGCIGCPLQSKKKRIEEFKHYPKMLKLYARGGGIGLIITHLTKRRKDSKMFLNGLFMTFFATHTKNFNKGLARTYLMMA